MKIQEIQVPVVILFILVCPFFIISCDKGIPKEFLKAEAEIKKKSYISASVLLRQAIQKDPKNEKIHEKLGVCFKEIEKISQNLVKEKKWEEARKYLESIFQFPEKDPIFYVNYATCLLAKPPTLETEDYKEQDYAMRSFTTYFKILGQENFPQEPLVEAVIETINNKIKSKPLLKSNVYSTEYTNQDGNYLVECYLYQSIAKGIIKEAKTEKEKVLTLFKWVMTQVMANVPQGKKEFDIKPKSVAFRGYGVCERSAHLFITLLKQLKIPAQLVQLHPKNMNNKEPVSTVVRVYFEKNWYIFDTLTGVPILKADGSLASFSEIQKNPALVDQLSFNSQKYLFPGESFQQAKIFIVLHPRAAFPKMRSLQKQLDLVDGPTIFKDLAKEIEISGFSTKEDLNQTLGSLSLNLWAFPFQLLVKYPDAKYLEERDQGLKEIYSFFQARILQILGKNPEAEYLYQQYLKSDKFEAGEDFYYFRSLNLLEMGKTKEATQGFQAYLKKFEKPRWLSQTHFHLGECFLLEKSPAEAKKHFQAVAAPLSLHIAWKYPQLFQ